MKPEKSSSKDLASGDLLGQFLDLASLEFNQSLSPPLPILEWAQTVSLPHGGKFALEGHEYQKDLLLEDFPRQVYKKGAQMGFTEISVLKVMHGLLFGRYPQGVLYLLPTVTDVSDFSRGRFGPFLTENPEIPLLIGPDDYPIPMFDTTAIHAEAAVSYSLS